MLPQSRVFLSEVACKSMHRGFRASATRVLGEVEAPFHIKERSAPEIAPAIVDLGNWFLCRLCFSVDSWTQGAPYSSMPSSSCQDANGLLSRNLS